MESWKIVSQELPLLASKLASMLAIAPATW
jgi:hypothetical protein